MTIDVTVENRGSEEAFNEIFVALGGLAGPEQVANNPYQSFSASLGSCANESTAQHGSLYCQPGNLAPGATVRIEAVVKVNETMNHWVELQERGQSHEDANNLDNRSFMKVAASVPPVVAGSPRIKLPGSPRLTATVPISRIYEPPSGAVYGLQIKARLKGGTRLARTVEFQLC